MFKKLMNNPIVGFLYGMITTFIIAIIMMSEFNFWIFAGITGIILVMIKEVCNVFMIGNTPNKVNIIVSSLAAIISAFAALFIL